MTRSLACDQLVVSGRGERVFPAEPGEATVVAVSRDPGASRFNGQGGVEGVLYEIPLDAPGRAEASEDLPVAWAGSEVNAIRMVAKGPDEFKGMLDRTRGRKDPGVRYNPKDTIQYEI